MPFDPDIFEEIRIDAADAALQARADALEVMTDGILRPRDRHELNRILNIVRAAAIRAPVDL